jgi:hypothetical protein
MKKTNCCSGDVSLPRHFQPYVAQFCNERARRLSTGAHHGPQLYMYAVWSDQKFFFSEKEKFSGANNINKLTKLDALHVA